MGIGEMLQCMMKKRVLKDFGEGTTHACGLEQLCSGLWVGIEGRNNAMKYPCEENWEYVGWFVLLVVDGNAFNKMNRTSMLWNI